MRPFVDHADAQEQRAGDDAVVDHLEDRAFETALVERKDPQRHKSHVADARIRDEPLDIRLRQGDVRAVHDRRYRKHQHRREEDLYGVGENRQGNSQQSVATHLQENSCQDDAPGSGRLGVRIRQPGVHGKHRHLDGERRGEGHEEPRLQPDAQLRRGERLEVECAVRVKERDQADEHQHASGEGEEQEFDRSIDPARASPHADEQKHGNEHALTIRMPPKDSARRPEISAVIFPRSRNNGRRRLNAIDMPTANVASTTMLIDVSRQSK